MPVAFKAFSGQEQKFIFHYLREGAVEEHVWIAEKKARLPKGTGVKLLKRPHVAREIERRKAGVELEQNKQIARDQARLAEETDKRQKVTLDKLETALDSIIALDAKKHGSIKLAAIQTGLVYAGAIRSGRMERTLPQVPEADPGTGGASSFYDSVFDEMRAREAETAPPPAPLLPEITPQQPGPVAPPQSRERDGDPGAGGPVKAAPPAPNPPKPGAAAPAKLSPQQPGPVAGDPKKPSKFQGATIT